MEEQKNAILVIEDPEGHLRQEIQAMAKDVPVESVHYTRAFQCLSQKSPRFVIFNLDHQGDRVKPLLETFAAQYRETYWILSSPAVTCEDLVEYLRLGINDYLKQPLDPKEFEKVLDRGECWGMKNVPGSPRETHQVFSFFSCKGGVGLSVAAVNLAAGIARKKSARVLVADFVLQHGNIAELLDLTPKYTLLDLSENLERLDANLIENSVQRHPSGIYVLPCPKHPEESEIFLTKETGDILKTLKGMFHYVILDVGHELNTTTLSCLDASDKIFLVTTPDLPSLCNAKIALRTFKKLGYKDGKVQLVLNRWHMKGEIDENAVEKSLGCPIVCKLADDPGLVVDAVNQGVPLRDLKRTADLSKGFDLLVEKVTAGVPAPKKKEKTP